MKPSQPLYSLDPTFTYRQVGGEIFGTSRDQAFHNLQNHSALFIFNRLASNPHSAQDLVKAMVSEYDISPEAALTDIEEFLEELVSRGIAITSHTPNTISQ